MRPPSGAARLVLVFSLCLVVTAVRAADDGSAAFSAGVEASRAGDHAGALAHFEAAREAGLDTPALDFNLGVVLYRLDRPDAAAEAFLRAYRSPRMAGPAAYSLGRIARDRGATREAADWYREAARVARTEALRNRAWAALDALDEPVPRLHALLALGAGHDSNATLAPEDVAGRERESDLFLDYEAFAHYRLDAGYYLFGGIAGEQYHDHSEADLMSLRAGFGWRQAPVPWRRDARLTLRQRYLDGTAFERALLGDVGTTRTAGAGDLRFGLGADHVEGRSGFRFLDGYRLRASARWRVPGLGGRWTLRTTASHTDRDDQEAPGFFASFSFTAAGVGIDHRRHIGAGRFLRLDARWTEVRHVDPEVRQGETLERRRESILTAGTELEWPLAPRWQLVTRLEATRRSSTVDSFAYDQVRLLSRIEREF